MLKYERPQILIIDDEADWRERIASSLESAGYNIHFAQNHNEALRLLKGEMRFDLICMNILLRGEIHDDWRFDWIDLLREAKSKGLSVIVITSMNSAVSLEDIYKPALEYGVSAVFFKNKISRETLLKKAEEILSISGNGKTRGDFLTAEKKNEIKQLVHEDQLEKVLEILQNKKFYKNEAIVRLGRLNRIKLQLRQGIINMEEADIQRTKIASEILQLISL